MATSAQEGSLPPAVGEVTTIARKLGRYMAADSVVTLPSEFALVYDTMSHDRAFLAGFVTCLISKLLSLGTPAEDRDLSELVLGTLLSSDADRSRGPVVRTDSKKSVSLRQQLLTTIYYIVFHYPLDMSHYTVSIVYKRWMTEAVRDGEFSVEDDIAKLMLSSTAMHADNVVKDLLSRSVQLAPARDELLNILLNGASYGVRSTANMLASTFLLQEARHASRFEPILQLAIQQIQFCAHSTSYSDAPLAYCFLIRELLHRGGSPSEALLMQLRYALRPLCMWPQPYSTVTLSLLRDVEVRLKSPGISTCLHFLEDRPDLLGGARTIQKASAIFNPRSHFGSAVRVLLQSDAPSDAPRTRFIQLAFRTILGLREGPNISLLSSDELRRLFNRTAEVILKAARSAEGQSSPLLANSLNSILAEAKDAVARTGKMPITEDLMATAENSTDLAIDWEELDEGAFMFSAGRPTDGMEFGAMATLERILRRHTDRSAHVHLKVAVVGGDMTVHNVACAYANLRATKKELFDNLSIVFYVVPAGRTNKLAASIGLADAWYGRQVVLGLRAAMSLVPALATRRERRASSVTAAGAPADAAHDTGDIREMLTKRIDQSRRRSSPGEVNVRGTTPASFVRGVTEHYLHHANHVFPLQVYQVEVIYSPSAGILQRRTMPCLFGFELGQRAFAASASANKRFSPPEVSLKYLEINVAGVAVAAPTITQRAFFSVQVSRFPRTAEHAATVRPSANCLELFLLDVDAGRKTANKKPTGMFDEGTSLYVNSVEIEDQSKRQFDMLIDNVLISGVHKVKLQPMRDPLAAAGAEQDSLVFPIATFVSIETPFL